jgi:uncharacterized protein YndB with AHSA1/START domain
MDDVSTTPDLAADLAAVDRHVERLDDDGGLVVVRVTRTYPAPRPDVWSAFVEPDRLARWFLPVSGDLRVGGEFATEGNASGRVLRCEPPALLEVTWGDDASIVRLTLSDDDAGTTTVHIRHSVPLAMAGSGAGALFSGPGWDQLLAGLAGYVRGEVVTDPAAAYSSVAGQRFVRASLDAWSAVIERSGTATRDEVAATMEAVLPMWTPDL